MNTMIFLVIIISSISNMVADVFLSSGRNYADKKQTILDRVRKTPETNLFISAVLGMASILCWNFPLYYLAKLTGIAGSVAKISFVMSMSAIATFHVVCCLALALYKADEQKEKTATRYLSVFGVFCFIPNVIYTAVIIYMGVTGVLSLQWFHYATLPLFSVMIIQFGVGNALKRVPYFQTVSGTLSMLVAILGTVHLMISNGF